ncbi:MAG: 50S ribosomal protein L9 [Chloroflexi bacterium]|nr:50S ribosomal protein L9 [Chloroflexota bacterium]
MRVVLKQEVRGLGRPGDIKDVADGYAQNFLLPRGLATPASSGALREVAQQKAKVRAKQDRAHGDAEELAKRLEATTLLFTLKSGKDGKTFGSVTNRDIAEALKRDTGIDLDRTKIHLEEPLRSLGVHKVEARLLSDVRAHLTVAVEPAKSS